MSTEKIYRSRLDNWLIAVMVIPLLIFLAVIVLTGTWFPLLIALPFTVFVTHMFANTYYTIAGTGLIVRRGLFINITIDISTIKSIAETNSILSAPATSLDRLEISYNKYDSVIISPKNKAEFIADILAINNDVKVTYKS